MLAQRGTSVHAGGLADAVPEKALNEMDLLWQAFCQRLFPG